MNRKGLIDLILIANLVLFAAAFLARRSLFPYSCYDIYREPMVEPALRGLESLMQAKYYALDRDGKRYELPSDHPFFFPFDRFLFSETVFFNLMRVEGKSPLDEAGTVVKRIRSQLKNYNSFPKEFRPIPLEKVQIYWADISLNENSENTEENERLLFEVGDE